MGTVEDLNKLISRFNALVERRLKAEQWFDLPTTTEADREKWTPTIFKMVSDTKGIVDRLESEGFLIKPEFWWEGI